MKRCTLLMLRPAAPTAAMWKREWPKSLIGAATGMSAFRKAIDMLDRPVLAESGHPGTSNVEAEPVVMRRNSAEAHSAESLAAGSTLQRRLPEPRLARELRFHLRPQQRGGGTVRGARAVHQVVAVDFQVRRAGSNPPLRRN